MSFDLCVFDMDDVPEDLDVVEGWLEDDSGWNAPPTARLASFIAELESSFPGLEDEDEESDEDEDDLSPWASWPLTETLAHGRGNSFNIRWSSAESMSDEFRMRCQAAGLTLYDQQEGVLIRPETEGQPARRPSRWWRRRET